MKRIFGALLTSILVLAGLLLPSAAQATTADPPSCVGMDVEHGTGECADIVESYSKSSSSSKVVAINGVSINSNVTVLANIKVNGTPKSQQTNCFRTKKAMSAYTSYNAEGTTGWHWKSYPKGYRFCKIAGKTRDPKCHNQVLIGRPKSKPPRNTIRGKVKFVKQLTFQAEAVAKADEKATSLAKAWCTGTTSYGYGEGRGYGSAYAVAAGRFSGYVRTEVVAKARAVANGNLSVQLGGRSVVKVKADVRASAFASAVSEATARAVCKGTPPPPPANKPPTGEIVQYPAHLYQTVNPGKPSVYRAKVVGSDPEDGGNVTLTYTVTGGASKLVDADHPEICDVEGTQKVCTFWIKAGSTAGVNATLSLFVTDSKGLTSPMYTKSWPIVADEF